MKKITYLLLPSLAFILLCFFACKKDPPTVVNGIVVDQYTKAPLKGVAINIHRWDENQRSYIYFTTIVTNEEGRFSFGDEKTPDFQFGQIRKVGYLYKHKAMADLFDNYQAGQTNEGVIEIIPLDGVLSLRVENLSGVHDTIFLAIFSPLLNSEIGISGGKVSLPNPKPVLTAGQSFSQNIPLASNQDVILYWDYKPVIYSTAFQAPATIIRGDTAFYTISY